MTKKSKEKRLLKIIHHVGNAMVNELGTSPSTAVVGIFETVGSYVESIIRPEFFETPDALEGRYKKMLKTYVGEFTHGGAYGRVMKVTTSADADWTPSLDAVVI